MVDQPKISGSTPKPNAEMLKAFDTHSVKGSWRKHRKIEEMKYCQCEITWLSKSHAVDLAGDVISPLTHQSPVPRRMQSIIKNIETMKTTHS